MNTERIDTRKLASAAREQLRRTVLRLHRRGHSQADIAAELGLRRPTVSARLAKAAAGQGTGEGQPGRRTGEGRRLTAAQEARIRKDLVDRTPDQVKLRFALWNARAVRAHIQQCFLVELPIRLERKYLTAGLLLPNDP